MPDDDAAPVGARPPATAPERTKLTHRPVVQRSIALGVRAAGSILAGLGPDHGGAFASFVARRVAGRVRETDLARRNLALAIPGKSAAEREAILAGVWDNLARTMAELPVIRELTLRDPADPLKGLSDRVEFVGREHAEAVIASGKVGIAFMAHLGNWEVLPAAVASIGVRLATLYRVPRNTHVMNTLGRWRGDLVKLAPSGPGAALRIARELKAGVHFSMMSDQRTPGGPAVPFFGRPAESNPIVARMARQFEAPILGVRCIRLPGSRFRVELTPPLEVPRDAEGRVDVDGATAAINAVIEGWVREHPEQWLWLHNRWGD
ncbi:MAG: lipid A biosynthesis lauroyl acyltransferase [Bauldia sp.]|nr:lipid A biosynthesis lauroyl acyltransferase [Bauldia sp.]